MPNTTFRLVAERYRDSGTDRRWRKIIAIALVVITVAAAVTVFRRDVDWESRNNEARRLGLVADRNGNFNSARRHYENALANDPYDWETNFDLANILMKRLNDLEGA
ncbi:MAG: tetratricopeptide repeat protein, partial [Planctomycetes bacterium]|nr:tetratricopeptide repeat protein [Planctomycetota bacterium]